MDGADLLARLAFEPDEAAILLDVDGVLAPIVDVPADATVPEATRAELHAAVDKNVVDAAEKLAVFDKSVDDPKSIAVPVNKGVLTRYAAVV